MLLIVWASCSDCCRRSSHSVVWLVAGATTSNPEANRHLGPEKVGKEARLWCLNGCVQMNYSYQSWHGASPMLTFSAASSPSNADGTHWQALAFLPLSHHINGLVGPGASWFHKYLDGHAIFHAAIQIYSASNWSRYQNWREGRAFFGQLEANVYKGFIARNFSRPIGEL